MKLLHITFHFEYSEAVEEILDRHEVRDFVRLPMMEGKDRDGKHFGTQVYPGNVTLVQAQVRDESVDAVLQDLRQFQEDKEAHRHLEALVLHIERSLRTD